MLVVVPVVIRPPERPALHRGATPEGEQKLARARGAVRLVREIAVVNAGDGEHPHEVEGHRGPDRHRARADPDDAEAAQVQDDEGHAPHPVYPVRLLPQQRRITWGVIGVDPLFERGEGTLVILGLKAISL